MSTRFEVRHPEDNKALAFGKDHACGEFLQIWDTTEYSEPDAENILVDEDALTGLTTERMKRHLKEHGFEFEELEEAWKNSIR